MRCDTWATVAELYEPASDAWAASLAFHPDSPVLATLGEEDKVIRIWKLNLAVLLRPMVKPTLLILAANPVATEAESLKLDEEAELIRQELAHGGEPGRRYEVQVIPAATPGELSDYFLHYKPEVVHFAGHGLPGGELVLVEAGPSRASRPVTAAAVARLFGALPERPKCLVLNACYSQELADQLDRWVDCVVGMVREIGDDAAREFARAFYRSLGHGLDFRQAFELGCVQIDLMALPDALVPHFTTREADLVAVPDAQAERSVRTARPTRTWAEATGGEAKTARPEDVPRVYRVWFGTNRRPIDPADPSQGFGPEDDRQLYYGTCGVLVPKSHKIGSVGSSWWRRWLRGEDDRLKLQAIEAMATEAFWSSIHNEMALISHGKRTAVVFIHGYNVAFEAAAIRAAQIGFDLRVPGIMAFYSWPSQASLLGYTADEATIEASEAFITTFLTDLAACPEVERVHVIAHSMGNRGLLRAVQRIVGRAEEAASVPFGHVVLAAPDVDARVFGDLAALYLRVARRTTLYASSKDRALKSSGLIHDAPCAGYTPPVTTVSGIDTVEVSNVDLTFLGHGYFAAARDLLHDLHDLLVNDLPPERRMGLEPSRDGRYWIIGA